MDTDSTQAMQAYKAVDVDTRVLAASPHQVSELLNHELGCSFFDYINRERVAAVQRGLR